MRPDIPWNVAGIPPEAREAARAAARREGLSVGEWMTRRILRSFSDQADAGGGLREAWPANVSSFNVAPDARASRRETEDMLAHVARSETESGEVFRRIEEQLRGVARRLEAAERSQSENNRAMSKAASEINVAAREQAQAFDQLGASVIGLADRIDRVERIASNEGLKDAVKGLHQGLTRVADQIATTASQSAAQISSLAGNLESVAGRIGEVRGDAEASHKLLEQRIAQIEEYVRTVERLSQAGVQAMERQVDERVRAIESKAQSGSDGVARRIEERLADAGQRIDDRIQALEEKRLADQAAAARQLSDRLQAVEQKTLADHDATARQVSERIQRVELLAQSNQNAVVDAMAGVELLKDEFAAAAKREVDAAGAIARLEESVARIEPSGTDPVIDQRLSGIERTLSEIASRFDHPEKAGAALEVDLKRLAERLDAAEAQQRDAFAELRAALKSVAPTVEAPHVPAPEPDQHEPFALFEPPAPPQPEPQAQPAPIGFDDHTDPFAVEEQPPHEPQASPFAFEEPEPPFAPAHEDTPPPLTAETAGLAEPAAPVFTPDTPFAHPDALNDPFAAEPPAAPAADSYLTAARRSARAAAQVESERSPRTGGFAWTTTTDEELEAEPGSRRTYIVIGIIALVLILAIVAGAVLSQRISATSPHSASALFETVKPAAPQPVAAKAVPAKPVPVTAPSSPVMSTVVIPPTDNGAIVAPTPSAPTPSTTSPIKPSAASPTKPPQAIAPAPIRTVPEAHAATSPAAVAPAVQPAPTRMATSAPIDKLSKLANAGNAKAELVVGLKYLDGDGVPVSETDAAKWLERAAEAGLPVAQYRLGTMYERGRGVAQDGAKAVHWYTLAAQAGNRKAMHNLAVAYASGSGVPKNLSEAARWFSKAAALGLSDSQFNLAVLYERGLGVPQSLLDAYKWYAIAAASGDAESKSRIDALATQLNADDRTAAQRAADSFRPQSLSPKANVAPQLSEIAN